MKQINIIAPIFGPSGYANHSRQLANALAKYADIKLITQLPQGWEMDCNDEELKMIKREDKTDAINLIIDLPHNWSPFLNKKINIGFLVWEGDKIPLSWIDQITNNLVSQVWVPSQHVYNAIKNTLTGGNTFWSEQVVMNKIKIVPHGVDLTIFKPNPIQEPRPFTLLCNKGFRHELDRGGIQHALRAFIQEFNKGEARLLLKINPAYSMPPDVLNQLINKYIIEAGKTPDKIGEIVYIMDNLKFKDLVSIYQSADVLLSPSEAEAFSMPCLEAMACGIPVITTNFGGQTDFVTNQNGWIVNGELHEIKHELIYEGIKWLRPNIEELRASMREAKENIAIRQQKASKAILDAQSLTWDNSALKSLEVLKLIE